MFLVDISTAQFAKSRKDAHDLSSESVEQRLVTRLRRLGYMSHKGKPRTVNVEKMIIAIAQTKPDMLKVIGEPLVYTFMDRER